MDIRGTVTSKYSIPPDYSTQFIQGHITVTIIWLFYQTVKLCHAILHAFAIHYTFQGIDYEGT